MMNVALIDHESPAAQRDNAAAAPSAASGEITLSHKLDALRELAHTMLLRVEELESSLPKRGAQRGTGLQEEVQRFEAEMIRDALRKTGGHQRRAARLLGVKVSTLNAKIKRYHIRPEEVVGLGGLHLVAE